MYNLAVFLDTCGNALNPLARREIAAVLSMPEVTRGGVIATAQSYIKALMSASAQRCLAPSSFSLQDVVDGKPLSIFLGSSPILVPGFEKRRNSLSFGDERINHRTLPSCTLGKKVRICAD